jgi:hypothetical protein
MKRCAGVSALLVLLLTAGCVGEALDRPGTFRATGANDANLRAMVADPEHLRRGVGADGARGAAAASAVDLLLSGKPRPLPTIGTSIQGLSGGSNGSR